MRLRRLLGFARRIDLESGITIKDIIARKRLLTTAPALDFRKIIGGIQHRHKRGLCVQAPAQP